MGQFCCYILLFLASYPFYCILYFCQLLSAVDFASRVEHRQGEAKSSEAATERPVAFPIAAAKVALKQRR